MHPPYPPPPPPHTHTQRQNSCAGKHCHQHKDKSPPPQLWRCSCCWAPATAECRHHLQPLAPWWWRGWRSSAGGYPRLGQPRRACSPRSILAETSWSPTRLTALWCQTVLVHSLQAEREREKKKRLMNQHPWESIQTTQTGSITLDFTLCKICWSWKHG